MFDIKEVSLKVKKQLEEKQQKVYAFEISEEEKRELNTENAEFTLFRTVFDNDIHVTTIEDGRKGAASGNDLTDEGIRKVVEDAISGTLSAQADDANRDKNYQREIVRYLAGHASGLLDMPNGVEVGLNSIGQ